MGNIFKHLFIYVTKSLITVPDPVTQLGVDLALEKTVLRSSWHHSLPTEALAINAECRNKFKFHWLDGRDDNGELIHS